MRFLSTWLGCRIVSGALLAGLTLCGESGHAHAAPPEEAAAPVVAKKPREPIYDEAANGKQQIEAALREAKIERKRVLVKFGGNWCGWCYKLHDVFTQEVKVRDLLDAEYVVVLVDVNTNRQLFESLGEDNKNQGFPFLTVLDEDGKVLVNQNTADLEEGPKHDVAKVEKFLGEWTLERQDAEKVLADSIATAKKDDKRVLLYFSAPWCGYCGMLTEYLYDERELFAKDYVVAKIDLTRMDHGQDVNDKFRKIETGIPWIAVLDSEGNASHTSEGPQGNIGYPVHPQEIAYFLEMVKATSKSLTADDFVQIEKSLVERAEKLNTRRQPEPEPASPTAAAGK